MEIKHAAAITDIFLMVLTLVTITPNRDTVLASTQFMLPTSHPLPPLVSPGPLSLFPSTVKQCPLRYHRSSSGNPEERYPRLPLQSAIAAPLDLAVDAFQDRNVWAGVAAGAAPVDKIGLVGSDVLPGVSALRHFGSWLEKLGSGSISRVDGKSLWAVRGYGALTSRTGRVEDPRRR